MLAIAGVVVAVLVAAASRTGFHRDEYYYLWGGQHLDWGFVDHPPLVPLVARGVEVLAGDATLLGLRFVAALVAGWLVVAGALVAREMGGSRRAQVLAAFGVACVPACRGPEALYGTTAADAAVWAILFVLVARLLRTRRPQLWLWIGLVTGIGLETKWLVGVLVASMVVGLVLTPDRRLLWTPWAAAGALVAAALWVPNLWWNATHGWAFLEFQRSVAEENGGVGLRLAFLPLLVVLGGVAPIIVWGPGWRWLVRSTRFRALGLAGIVVVVAVFLAGGKPYYVAPLFVPLLAAGGLLLDGAAERRRRRAVWVLGITGLLTIPLTVPVLPDPWLGAVTPVNPEPAEMVGWPELAETVRAAYEALPAAERARTVVLTDNYGTADALARHAPELPVHSAQNSHWLEGPPPDGATTVLAVGRSARSLTWCGDTEQVGTITNEAGVANRESGRPIVVCRDLTQPWPDIWDQIKDYG